MKAIFKKFIYFPITLPLVFILLFYGYFPIHFDMTLYTDNVVGEGICETFLCSPASYAGFYRVGFYFGSELQKASIRGFNYDVKQVSLTVSDCSEFDLLGFETSIHGIPMFKYSANALLSEGETANGTTATLHSTKDGIHVEVYDPKVGTTITIGMPFIKTWFWALYFIVIIVVNALVSLLVGYFARKLDFIIMPLMTVATIQVTILAGCYFCGSLPLSSYTNILLNSLFLAAAALLINSLSLPFVGSVCVSLFTTICYIINYFVINLRSKPVMPADIKAIGTATEVMGGYTFAPTWKMIVGIIAVVCYCVATILVWRRIKQNITIKNILLYRIVPVFIAVILFIVGINSKAFRSLESFAWDAVLLKSFHEEGMILTFLKSVVNSQVKKPEGYSKEAVNSLLLEYIEKEEDEEEGKEGVQPTNIIMIMNEAFSDLRTVGLDENVDVMPFIDSLQENTIKGSLVVSVFGGGTCNTEFEALTGNTLAFMGTGAYPYTENITNSMFSLASLFKKEGYITEAFHANKSQNWNRNMVYPNIGFQSFKSIEEYKEYFGNVPMLHNQPADVADYTYIEEVDNQISPMPRFIFNVTMQNHSDYARWLDVEEDNSIKEFAPELYVDTRVYLSLIKASDESIEQLVEKYKNSEEPTMIVFFGDHQPGLPGVAQNEIYTKVFSYLDFFRTKFFIWTNYDSTESDYEEISANYLPYLILKQGNFEEPPFIKLLEEVHEKYPVISAMGVIDADGNIYASVNDLKDDPLIQKYRYVQYANLFDELDDAWFTFKD